MEQRRWLNQAQPQTLQIAVFLLYIDAVFGVLTFSPMGIVVAAAAAGAGWGIANELRWGYWLGIGVSFLALYPYIRAILAVGPGVILGTGAMLGFLIAVAHFALLLHPQSRNYQKVWFK
jgi:hypothetical protein